MNYLGVSERFKTVGKKFLLYLVPLSIILQGCDNMTLGTAETKPKNIIELTDGAIYQYSHFRVEEKGGVYTAFIEEGFTPIVFAEKKLNTSDGIRLCISVGEEIFTVGNGGLGTESNKVSIIVEKKQNPGRNRKHDEFPIRENIHFE